MAAVNICSDFRAQEKEICHCFCIFPFCLPCNNGARCYDLSFFLFILSFKPVLSLLSFILIKRFFSFSLLSAIRVVSSAYLRLLMFLPPILIPAYNLSSLPFLMMCSAYNVKQAGWQKTVLLYSFLNLQPIICSTQGSNCCFLTHKQVSQETCKMVWYFHLFKSLSQFVVIYTLKGCSVVDKNRGRCFFWNSLAFSIIHWKLEIWYWFLFLFQTQLPLAKSPGKPVERGGDRDGRRVNLEGQLAIYRLRYQIRLLRYNLWQFFLDWFNTECKVFVCLFFHICYFSRLCWRQEHFPLRFF